MREVPSTVRLVLLAVLVISVSTQPVFLLGAAFFQIGPELGIGPFGLGALTAAFFLAAAAASAPLGRWVQRVGWQRAMRVNTSASSLVMLLVAVLASNPWAFGALLVLAAAVYGMANPAANQALADHTDPHRQATVFGLKHAGIPTSTMLAGLAVPGVVLGFGWRWAFVLSACMALAVGMLVPRGAMAPRQRGVDRHRTSRPPPPAMSLRWLVGLGLASAFATWGAVALGSFGVSAGLAAGMTAGAAGWLQFVGSASSIGVRVVAGAITDRAEGWGFGGLVVLTGIGAVVLLALAAASGALFAALVVLAYATAWGWPGLMTFTVVNANRGSVASSSSITQAGTFLGAGIGPLLVGAAIERWSYDGGWLVSAFGLATAAVVVVLVGRRFRSLVARPGMAPT